MPHDEESKNIEFDHAEFGMINLQTVGANLVALSEHVGWDVLLEKVTTAPRKILNLDLPLIDIEAKANLTLFDPSRTWTFDEKSNFSRSKNSPWLGQQITGKAIAVFNNGRHWLDL